MRTALLILVLALAGCGSKSKSLPTQVSDVETPDCKLDGPDQTPTTAEQCQCLGHEAVGDIGDGQVKCPEGKIEVSRIRFGIEGGVCCTQPVPMPTPAAE